MRLCICVLVFVRRGMKNDQNRAEEFHLCFACRNDGGDQMVTKSELNISINSFVRNALEFQLKQVKREQFRRNIAEASQDQLFLADVAQCQKDFRFLDKEEFDEW